VPLKVGAPGPSHFGDAGGPGPKEVNRATEGGCPGSLAFGDPGDREPQPDHSPISDVPVVSPPIRPQSGFSPSEGPGNANGKVCQHSIGQQRRFHIKPQFARRTVCDICFQNQDHRSVILNREPGVTPRSLALLKPGRL
jgi:hypothetical protein